jgi:predicted N-acetyltransferase YhbS
MEIVVREIAVNDYSEVMLLWTDVLGNHNVNYENFHITMERMYKEGNYKTFVALSENRVVGFIAVMQALAMGFPIGYLHVQGFAVHKEVQHKGIGVKVKHFFLMFGKHFFQSEVRSFFYCTVSTFFRDRVSTFFLSW